MPVATDRRLSIVLLIAGVLLAGLGGVRMLSAVSTLRAQALTEAESHLSQRLPSALAGGAAAVRDQVQQLVSSDDGSSFIYITVRDANAGVLASAGSHAGVFAWLPAGGTARAWRAWLYRALSAQSVWQISDAHSITVGFGLSWIRLLTGSLSAWAVWGLLSCLSMVIVVRAAAILRGDRTLGESNPASARIAAGSSAPCAPSNTAEAQPRTVCRPGLAFIGGLKWPLRAPAWAGNGRRSRTGAREFEMIGGRTPTRAPHYRHCIVAGGLASEPGNRPGRGPCVAACARDTQRSRASARAAGGRESARIYGADYPAPRAEIARSGRHRDKF